MPQNVRASILGLAALALLVIGSSDAFARTVHATWTPPTQFTDGSALDPATDLSAFKFYCGTTLIGQAMPDATATDLTIGGAPCALTATAVGVNGAESDMSNAVMIDGLAPKPPTLLDAVVAFLRRLFHFFV